MMGPRRPPVAIRAWSWLAAQWEPVTHHDAAAALATTPEAARAALRRLERDGCAIRIDGVWIALDDPPMPRSAMVDDLRALVSRGSRVPSVDALAGRHGVTAHTARRWLRAAGAPAGG